MSLLILINHLPNIPALLGCSLYVKCEDDYNPWFLWLWCVLVNVLVISFSDVFLLIFQESKTFVIMKYASDCNQCYKINILQRMKNKEKHYLEGFCYFNKAKLFVMHTVRKQCTFFPQDRHCTFVYQAGSLPVWRFCLFSEEETNFKFVMLNKILPGWSSPSPASF